MKVLVTGASGFLGRELTAQLLARGHEVVRSDRVGEVDYRGDLTDQAFCRRLPVCDAIAHAAAVQYVSPDLPWIRRRYYFTRNNVIATENLCAQYDGTATHLVFIGTSMMYAQCRQPVYRITSRMEGQGIYSRSKLAAQAALTRYTGPHATVIPCIIGGPGREGLFRGFVASMIKNGMVLIPGSGDHPTHMVHVEDIASLVVHVIEARAEGFFNAAGPEPLSISEWVSEIESALHLTAVRRYRLPLAPVVLASALTGYRILAREQLLMLSQPHVLATDESMALGWTARHSNASIVRDIARYIAGAPSTMTAD